MMTFQVSFLSLIEIIIEQETIIEETVVSFIFLVSLQVPYNGSPFKQQLLFINSASHSVGIVYI